jgi:MerR family transcriptional regulator, heat shock protein HspR
MAENNSPTSDRGQEALFSRPIAAQLARITLDFLSRLEEGKLIRPRTAVQGEPGYCAEDITQISRIRRLHEDLGLDLEAVEIILHMRRQILTLLRRMEEMERRLAGRERELVQEIQELRRRLGVRVERK